MRGFVITILSMSLIVLLLILTMSVRNAHLATERALIEPLPLVYSSFLLDDAANQFNSIAGPKITLRETNESTGVTVADTIHPFNHSAEILAYSAFLEGEVAERTASNISANFTNITGGEMRVFINEDYTYVNDHADGSARFSRAGGTGAAGYEINVTVYSVRQNVSHMAFSENGTMNVTIRYTDLNGTEVESGSVFADMPNSFTVNYPDGTSLNVDVGLAGGNPGSLKISSAGAIAETAFTATLPRLDAKTKRGYEYDAVISYSQGPVVISRRLGK
jgi:hypothetical protein